MKSISPWKFDLWEEGKVLLLPMSVASQWDSWSITFGE